MRRTSILALLATSVVTGTATTAPAAACRLVRDPSGDVEAAGTATYADPRIDVVSADLGTDARHLTAVVRVADLDAATQPATGLHWHLEFAVDGEEYHVVAERLADGDRFVVRRLVVVDPGSAGAVNTTEMQMVATAGGVLDPVANEVRITVPLSAFAGHAMRRGTRLADVKAYAYLGLGSTKDDHAAPATYVEDTATATRPFVMGTASCVRVGR